MNQAPANMNQFLPISFNVGSMNQTPTHSINVDLLNLAPAYLNHSPTDLNKGLDSKLNCADDKLLNLRSPFIEGVDSGIPVESLHIVFA